MIVSGSIWLRATAEVRTRVELSSRRARACLNEPLYARQAHALRSQLGTGPHGIQTGRFSCPASCSLLVTSFVAAELTVDGVNEHPGSIVNKAVIDRAPITPRIDQAIVAKPGELL